ncbi:hypothetical protein [Pigmentiphaga kullae]|uniref:Uncharacterized protein n=1 Tax=Pigmentiphaga kullae TaxID=151784 RepID=A0A4Q7NE93_9BURK|nr:hypothetical protein [Pigmentiphaga kullae]RZS81432.1 hypothetical protein EV675_4055 [Pigmentiphaga kullae]
MNARDPAVARDAAECRWRRRSLWLLVILVPLAMAVVMHDSARTWWSGRARIAREVPAGGQADLGGASWRLRALRMAPLPAGKRIPENAMGVVAEFAVQVRDADVRKNWAGCEIALEDGQGRRWMPTRVLPLPRSEARECVLAAGSGPKAGDTVRIRHAFLVPRDAAAALRATVALGPQRPRYLRFAQPPTLVQ